MALGKGLGALITSTGNVSKKNKMAMAEKSEGAVDKIWEIPITSIEPNADQPRKVFDQEKLEELAMSIKEHGVLQPLIVVEKENGKYELIAGERRWRASRLAGLADVPCVVRSMVEEEKVEIALIENIQREDLNPLEEAFSYQRLMDEFGLTQQEVADKVGKSRPAVANFVRLLGLPEEAKKALMEKKISMGQGRALLGLKDDSERLDMLSSMLGQKMTVRDLEREVNRKKGFITGDKKKDANLAYIEGKLREKLGTKVSVIGGEKKGKICIEYYSQEELRKIFADIIGE